MIRILNDWRVPVGLIFLSLIPLGAGLARLGALTGVIEPGFEMPVLQTDPATTVVHILSISAFCLLGAFQFAPRLRRSYPGWHREVGSFLVPAGLIAAVSGIWLTVMATPASGAEVLLFNMRLFFGAAMALFLILGLRAIRGRDVPTHRAWMMRAFAVALGAGTTPLLYLPVVALADAPGPLGQALLMGAGWIINLAVAEWLIHRNGAFAPRAAGSLGT